MATTIATTMATTRAITASEIPADSGASAAAGMAPNFGRLLGGRSQRALDEPESADRDDELGHGPEPDNRVRPHLDCRVGGASAEGVSIEVEEFLYTHPDVLDAQVVGVPDVRYGEEQCVWIKLRPGAEPLTADGLREFVSGKLAHYKIPRYVILVDDCPMTITDKIRKVEMRAPFHRLAEPARGGGDAHRVSGGVDAPP